MAMVESGGAQVSYTVHGQGPGLLLVHGTGGDSRSHWGHLLDRFTERWTVVTPDYAGSGTTVDDGRALSVEGLAAQVVAAAEAAGTRPFDVVGFSLGASIAAHVAAEYPELVRSVVLLAGFASADDQRLRLQFELWRDMIDRDRPALARLMLLAGFSPAFLSSLTSQQIAEYVEFMVTSMQWEGTRRQIELDLTLDIRKSIARIAKPTLVIGCTQDQMVPPAHAKALAQAIPGARYAELDTGHLAAFEKPEEFMQLVSGFLLTGR